MKGNMKQRFILYQRSGTFYCEDTQTRKQQSLRTKDEAEAKALLHSKNEAFRQPLLNQQIALAYLSATDSEAAKRTWQFVMDEMTATKRGDTHARHVTAMKDKAFDLIRTMPLLETRAEHLLKVLRTGTVATNVYLRRLHNFALDMSWQPKTILPRKQWPKPVYKEKRAITLAEHEAIVAREQNTERRGFYQLAWHIGAAQTDLAMLKGGGRGSGAKNHQLFPPQNPERGAAAFRRGHGGHIAGFARHRPAIPVSGHRPRQRPGDRIQATVPGVEHQGGDTAFLLVCVGRARENGGVSRTIRARGAGPQQPGRASDLRQAGAGVTAALGRLREKDYSTPAICHRTGG